jgi:glycosyltransferase involved in cell wall biosynthesis
LVVDVRVVLTVPSLARAFGGPVDKATGLRAALREHGTDARIVGAGVGEGDGLPTIGAIRGTPIPRSFERVRWAVRHADVVHILGYRDPVGTVAARTAVRAGVPYVFEPCGMHRPRLRSIPVKRAFDRTLGRAVVDHAAIVIATSELERRELMEGGIAERRIRTRLNGLTLPARGLPVRGTIRARFRIPPAAPLVLALGRIARKKGLLDLVRAVSPLPSVHLLIAGPDAGDGALHEVRRAAPMLDGRLHVETDGLWDEEKLAAFADADCFALPSQTENFANAAAEAAAAGVPVVVSVACGVAEVLDRSAHRVVVPGTVNELTAAIADLVRPEARKLAMSVADDLRSRLDWTRLAKEQLAIYEGVPGS